MKLLVLFKMFSLCYCIKIIENQFTYTPGIQLIQAVPDADNPDIKVTPELFEITIKKNCC